MFSRVRAAVARHKNATNGGSDGRFLWRKDKFGASTVSSFNCKVNASSDEKLGFVRRFLTVAGGRKGSISWACLSNSNYLKVNPGIRRFFSNDVPRRRIFENYRVVGRPKIENKKSAGDISMRILGIILKKWRWLLVMLVVWSLYSTHPYTMPEDKLQINFHEFKTKLLDPGLVDHIVISNKSIAKIYVRSMLQNEDWQDTSEVSEFEASVNGHNSQEETSQYRYYINIGSVKSFEEKLVQAQKAMGRDPHDYVQVTYISEIDWISELIRSVPIFLLMASIIYVGRCLKQGFSMESEGVNHNEIKGHMMNMFKSQDNMMNMRKAQITKLDTNSGDKIYFKDVAGCDEAKQEIMEFVHFLKDPQKYKKLGAKIPRGALLVGPPGTGKTLLAKATAGESGVPFLSISGSDFTEIYIGVGASRVRDLFQEARKCEPSIVFIDEIDAIGRTRGHHSYSGGNEEREGTLNQLLVEMDGIGSTVSVVILAGTNRADILDKALLRPGRFDRQITIDVPDIKGREQIFLIYLRKIALDQKPECYSERLASRTPTFSGADIKNVCNEAALIAARDGETAVKMEHFDAAIDRVLGGLEKKNKVLSVAERQSIAYHESGHAVVSWFLKHGDSALKVSIVPRGSSGLGFAQYAIRENVIDTKEQVVDRTIQALGGRAAEELLLGRISSGALDDLNKVTRMTYGQVAALGFSEKVGLVSFPEAVEGRNWRERCSEETAAMIDGEVREWIGKAYKVACSIIEEHKEQVEEIANLLLEKETLVREDLVRILGNRPYKSS